MGRETFLAKVTWENGWPVIAEGIGHLEDTLELPTKEYRFPEEVSSTSDHISFWEKTPDKRLVSVEEIREENYSLRHRPGMLRLYTKKEKISGRNHCSYFGIRQKNYAFYAETGMEFEPKQECETAGMVLYQNHENHLRMEIRKRAEENCFVVTACIHEKCAASYTANSPLYSAATVCLPAKRTVLFYMLCLIALTQNPLHFKPRLPDSDNIVSLDLHRPVDTDTV